MKVSVAIGTWNRVDMVRQAIEAALDQTLKPDEIVVFDDASPDKTFEILSAEYLNHPIVKIFKQPQNTGGVPNWNAAIGACSGDYIAWCSDDDRWFKWHLEKAIGFLEKNKDIALIHAAFCNSYEDSGEIKHYTEISEGVLSASDCSPLRSPKPIEIDSSNILQYYLKYYNWPFHPSTMVFRKKAWEDVGAFDARYELADTDWFLKMGSRHRLALLPYYGVLNRRHLGNWSNAMGGVKMQKEQFAMVKAYLANPLVQITGLQRIVLRLKWRLFFQQFIFRIYISRSRYGYFDSAKDAINFFRAISIFYIIPQEIFEKVALKMSSLINYINTKFNSKSDKGKSLGKFVPK